MSEGALERPAHLAGKGNGRTGSGGHDGLLVSNVNFERKLRTVKNLSGQPFAHDRNVQDRPGTREETVYNSKDQAHRTTTCGSMTCQYLTRFA